MNTNFTGGYMLRQGDVLLIPAAVPQDAKTGKRIKGKIILAYGEVTGHHHAIADAGVRIYEHEGTRYIRVPAKGATLTHQEHGHIAVAGGEYRVVIQREYSPEAVRNVQD